MIHYVTMSTSTRSSEVPVGLLLMASLLHVRRWIGEVLLRMGWRPGDVMVLAALRHGPVHQRQLGTTLGLDPSQVVTVLENLEQRGLVSRRPDPAHRRRRLVVLSSRGRTQLASVIKALAAVDDRLLIGLDRDQRAELRALLSHVADTAGAVVTPVTDRRHRGARKRRSALAVALPQRAKVVGR